MSKTVGIKEYFKFVENVSTLLDKTLLKDVQDIEYGQWEVPFEAILLFLIELPKEEISLDYELVKALAYEADIIEFGVLDMDTWDKFEKWALSE